MSLPILSIIVLVSTVLLTGLIRLLAPSLRLIDEPVSRSAHVKPTPVGGGLAIVIVFLAAVSYCFWAKLIPFNQYMALFFGAGIIAVLGLLDDLKHLHIKWRIPVQFAAAVWVVAWLGGVPAIDIGLWQIQNPYVLNVLGVLALVWLLNLYNFMDGIDGLAASESVYVSAASLIIVIGSGDELTILLATILMTCSAGFLFWNWAPARIFLGDVGSGFIGFTLGILALLSMSYGSMSVWTWVLLLAVFIVDATVTLLKRIHRGDKWYEGHANHAYQYAARRYKSHSKVTITVILVNCLCLAPLALLSVKQPNWGIYLSFLGIVPLTYLVLRLGSDKRVDLSSADANAEAHVETEKGI